MLAIYVSLKSLMIGVNTVVWSDNANDVAPILCDICEQSAFIVPRHASHRITDSISLERLHRGFDNSVFIPC